MSGTQCEFVYPPGQPCENEAIQKCTGLHCNGGVYCVKHIQLIDFRYICDTCIQETERISREAERIRRETERELVRERILAREHSRQQSKIRYPRVTCLLSIILIASALLLAQANTPSDGTPLVSVNPLLAYACASVAILGLILFLITWVWVVMYAIRRGQGGWVAGLLFVGGIAIPLYLILDPLD